MNAALEIVEESLDKLAEYGEIPIRFEVRSVFEVEGDDPGSALLLEHAVEQPWVKDYDAISGEKPANWPKRWDISNWGLLVGYAAGRRAGGCAIAFNTDGVNMLEGRDDVAVLWDLRVLPQFRGKGIGRELFAAAARWARTRHCRELKAETQNINVPACRFYERQGCRLTSIDRLAYEAFPEEVQLIWTLSL
jgi:GNAT superfamily N-acetyltransferase